MQIDLTGIWDIELEAQNGIQKGTIQIPGILQAQGYGNDIGFDTPWVSSLHDSFWFEREEYQMQNQINIPFLSQPPKHFLGKAYYKRTFEVLYKTDKATDTDWYNKTENNDILEWYLFIELVHWRTKVFIDGVETGGDCSLCTPHVIPCGKLSEGRHEIIVEIDNSMQYPYRPDGHGVSDALGATWNGMAGEIILLTRDALALRNEAKKVYAKEHPRHIEIKNGMFFVDGRPEYFRGTHFGGDYPITGYPETDKAWWDRICCIIKEWGLNFIRCHSCCPPEAAFLAADEAGIYIQPECGMWNHFEDDSSMLAVLKDETRRILEQFGHHPSFVLFSPTNEPSGNWYHSLRQWVIDTRNFDKQLGYEGRRVYTAQSGWFYDVPPKEITGTDYLYFHRSAFGPFYGGMIRNQEGWKDKDYSPSLKGAQLPVICHELGQWTAYPDFDVIEKFTGYLQPSNYKVFKEHCKRQGLYGLNHEFAYASGRNQLRLYKEDIEANLRTKELYGFEMLDLHDYLGQGTALVGVLDAFWNEKGYVKPWEFRQFCDSTILLARFPTYVFEHNGNTNNNPEISVEVCHFGVENYDNCVIKWWIEKEHDIAIAQEELSVGTIAVGQNTPLGKITLPVDRIQKNSRLELALFLYRQIDIDTYEEITSNTWEFFVYCIDNKKKEKDGVVYTHIWQEAKSALTESKRVIYSPRLSELSYECPPISIKNVFWNAQMGAKWGRSLGLLIDETSPIFQEFPTDKTGGWQWEEILSCARAFDISGFGYSDFEPEGVVPIVRVIDDWNRNLPLALIFEVRTDKGKLLVVSADLDLKQNQKTRFAARALKMALINYVASEVFQPKTKMSDIELDRHMKKRLFPIYRMKQLVKKIEYPQDASVENGQALISANPEQAVVIKAQRFPVNIVIEFDRKLEVNGILYVPDQAARKRRGFIKEYVLRVQNILTGEIQEVSGILKNTSLSQEIYIPKTRTEQLELSVLSIYGDMDFSEWIDTKDGYYKVEQEYTAEVKIGGIHLICDTVTAYEEVFIEQPAIKKKPYKKTEIEN